MNDREHASEHTGWRARRKARIERVAAGGPLWARRRPTAAQVRRRRLTAVGCCLALGLGVAVTAELGNDDGADSGPRTALRPEGAPSGDVVSDDGTAGDEFAEGGTGDAARANRRDREARLRDREARLKDARDRRRARSSSRRTGPSDGSVAGVPLPAQTAPAPVVPSPPPTVVAPRPRVTPRVAPERRRPARRRRRAPAPAPQPPPILAAPTPVPAPAPVDDRDGGKGHHHHHHHHGDDDDDEDEDDDHDE